MINDTVEKITELLFIGKSEEELQKYDLVIVFGSNVYDLPINVLKDFKSKNIISSSTKIVLSGNKGSLNNDIDLTEAELMYNYAKSIGFEAYFILEKEATNIKENLVNSQKLLGSLDSYNKILFIGKSFVLRRILMCALTQQYPIDKIDMYGIEDKIKKDNWSTDDYAKTRVLEELERISKYTKNNDLSL